MAFLDSLFGPVFQPMLNESPFLAILIISVLYAVYATLVYKYMTDQPKIKAIKDKQKAMQKQIKELRSNPQEMMKVQKEMMSVNKEYMMNASFKPKVMIATMLPAFIVFAWMAGALAFEPIYPGETYSISAAFPEGVSGDVELLLSEGSELVNSAAVQPINSGVTWRLKSTEGTHFQSVKYGDEVQDKEVLITKELKYLDQVAIFEGSEIESIKINYNKLKPLGTFSIFGWHPGWLGTYIILSLVFSIVLRKVMKVY
ncbi:TPA: DUF106 domain-containing protein [Candidatus Woesearchaeota archaeon]|nr:hypothetical protein [archaeon]HIJ11746.1 DUF106 domain-containing protein [Candidatus Woesearchaeota archaeon]